MAERSRGLGKNKTLKAEELSRSRRRAARALGCHMPVPCRLPGLPRLPAHSWRSTGNAESKGARSLRSCLANVWGRMARSSLNETHVHIMQGCCCRAGGVRGQGQPVVILVP